MLIDELYAFACDPDAPHAAASREFDCRVGADGTVGVWHETYHVGPGRTEAVYDNMPAFGLAAACRHIEVGPGRQTARARLKDDAQTDQASGPILRGGKAPQVTPCELGVRLESPTGRSRGAEPLTDT